MDTIASLTAVDWPVYFAANVSIGNPDSGLGICLLWTPQERTLPLLDPQGFAVLGNLYSRDGINFLLRNLLARPTLQTLVLCGRDMTGSGAALAALFANGIDAEHRIIGEGTRLHPEIPAEAVALVRRHVRLIDARDCIRPEAIAERVRQFACPAATFAEPQVFPYREPTSAALPAEDAGFVVRAATVRHAYLNLLRMVMRFGQRSGTQHTSDQRELLDVLTVISEEPSDPQQFSHAEWMPFTRESLGDRHADGRFSGYLAQFLQADPSPNVSYTYGERLRNFSGFDQVAALIADLRHASQSRRAVAVLWNPLSDAQSSNPPCLNLVQARVRGDRVFLSAYFRSHDMYRAWAANAYGLRALQGLIAEALDLGVGSLSIHSHSAHIYAHDWEAVAALLDKHSRSLDPKLSRDPRGAFVISLADGQIHVRHYTHDGTHLQSFHGATAREVANHILPFISEISHAIYLGAELQKAELALQLGQPERYTQDRPLELR